MSALTASFRQLLASSVFIWLIYGITLALGLLAALPFYNTLKIEDQNSREFLALLDGFNYTIYSDFMHRSGRTISPLMSVGRWLGVLYVFLSVFFAGGILRLFSPESRQNQGRVGDFFALCSRYMGRFLRLFGVVVLFVLAGAVIWLVIGGLMGVLLSDTFTERGLFWIGVVSFILFVLSATLILCIGDYAKIVMFRDEEQRVFRAFGQAGRLVLRNLGRTYGVYWLFIGLGTALFGLYFLLDGLIPMQNWATILVMFIIQQALVFGRVGLKVWWLGAASDVYSILPKPEAVYLPAPLVIFPTPLTDPDKAEPEA